MASSVSSPQSQTGSSGFVLDERTANMTVKEFWNDYLEKAKGKLEEMVDDALDAVGLEHKQLREELRNMQHEKQLALAAQNEANRLKQWNVFLKIVESSKGLEDQVGRTFRLCPRLHSGGMCRIGRSTGDGFREPNGVSLSFDGTVSVWHAKITCVYGQVFYTDLKTRNGSKHNGVRMDPDHPVGLKDGDRIQAGDTTLEVSLEAADSASESNENMEP